MAEALTVAAPSALTPTTLPDRIRRRVHSFGSAECWEWTGAKTSDGYGRSYLAGGFGRNERLAHRGTLDVSGDAEGLVRVRTRRVGGASVLQDLGPAGASTPSAVRSAALCGARVSGPRTTHHLKAGGTRTRVGGIPDVAAAQAVPR